MTWGIQMLFNPRAVATFCHQAGGAVWEEAHTQEDRMKNMKKEERTNLQRQH